MSDTKSYEKLMGYALRILSKKRYTCSEMQKKLKSYVEKRELEEEQAGVVMERLKELRYLNDEEYARNYIEQRIRLKPRGKFLMNRELTGKGLNKDLVEEVIDDLEIDELEVAVDALRRRSRVWKEMDERKFREKSFRFLSSRGFKVETIYKALESCYNLPAE